MSHATSDKNLEVSFENKKASETTDALKRGVGTVSCLAELKNKFLIHRPENVSLFKDFETYSTSLPVRKRNKEWLKLHTLPYFCSDEDVTRMATQLEQAPPSNVRDSVKYVCAPSGSGKTCSILPAFLKSKFTHYLYIAFDNNNGRKFTLAPYKPSLDERKAEKQGAAFILKCVTLLLSGDGPREISVEEHCITRCPTGDLKKLIHQSFGPDSKVLFHVDEHRKMCSRSGDADDPGACFSRGAMETLAAVGTVVATYIEPPPARAGLESSSVCRQPVALPCLDLEKILTHVNLVLPRALNKENNRLLPVLRTRIAMALQPAAIGVGGLHRIRSSKEHATLIATLKNKLHAAAKQRGENKTARQEQKKFLQECIFACPLPRCMTTQGCMTTVHEHATDLLLGMSDERVQEVGRRMNNLVVLPNGHLSTTIFQLFSFQDKDEARNRIYKVGRDRFHHAIQHDKDCMSGRPLEEAYLWTLSCSSLLNERLFFTDIRGRNIIIPIKCTNIKPGRIFRTNDTAKFDFSDLQHNTMYYADETGRGENKYSHPLADMFFRTEDNHLVLIDIKGATVKTVKSKVTHLAEAIRNMQGALATGLTYFHIHRHTFITITTYTHRRHIRRRK